MEIVNEAPKVIALDGTITETILNEAGEVTSVKFEGYSGDAVNLGDYGFDAPVVYDLSGMDTPKVVPLMYKHYQEIGHTTNVANDGSKLDGDGILSIPNTTSKEVGQGMKNKFPYQASMGLTVSDRRKIDYTSKGEVRVNNRVFQGPIYVVRNSKLKEMSVTPFGRDGNTSFKFVNEDDLMAIKNSESTPTPPVDPPINNIPDPTPAPAPTPAPTPVVENNLPTAPAPQVPSAVKMLIRTQKLLNQYPTHTEIIENGMENGWDDERITNAIKLDMFENGLPNPPRHKKAPDKKHDLFEARVMLSYGVSVETVEAQYGEKIANEANDLSEMTVVEQILYCANNEGGDYTGHSDVDQMCDYYKNSGYSGIDLPNLLRKTAITMLEERWKLNPPFASQHCKEESNKDFRKTERRRIVGGGLWEEIDEDGKIPHYKPGKDTRYESSLKTVGSIFTMTRVEVINDDQGALRDLMDVMVEDAMLTPDIQLGKLMFKAAAANTFWVDTDNSHTSKALTRSNLIDLYQAARQYNEARSTINWNTLVNDQWKLIHSVAKEDEVFEILQQDRLVSNTTANTIQGQKNYLYNKLMPHVFAQMGNTSAFGTGTFVSDGTYFLWPTSGRFAPYSINYLKGRKRPVIEAISLPGDMLGKGVRGYWDVKVNERERLTVIRANG
jgi:hypothetical protein